MANTFNPQADLPNAQNFLGYSKGVSNNALGTFAGNVAEGLDTGLKALDRGVDQMANDEVRAVVNDADASILGIQNQPPRQDPLESEIKNQVDNLKSKKLAMDNGTIDPDHYYATIMARTKDIRARYPGYNEQIDQHLKEIGIDPNWQRRRLIEEGLKAEQAREASLRDFEKNNREYAESAFNNPKVLMDPALSQRFASDPFAYMDPKFMSGVKASVVNSNAIYARNDLLKSKAERLSSDNTMKADSVGKAYSADILTLAHVGLVKSNAAKIFQSALANVNQDRTQNGGVVSPEHMSQLATAFANFKQEANNARLKIKSQQLYVDNASIASKQMADTDKMFDDILDDIEKNITNKDWGALYSDTNTIKYLTESAEANVLNKSQTIRTHKAMRNIIGDVAFNDFAKKNLATAGDPFDPFYQSSALADKMTENVKSHYQAMVNLRQKGAKDPMTFQKAFTGSVDLMLDPNTNTQGALTLARTMYSPENNAFWDNIMLDPGLKDKDRRAYFQALSSPKMTQKINELATTDPTIKRQYYAYLQYMSMSLNKQGIDTINDNIVNSSNSTVTYDPATHSLQVVPVDRDTGNPTRNFLSNFWEGSHSSAKEAVNNMNTTINALIPIYKDQGINIDEAIPQFIARSGINLDATKQGNNIERGGKAVQDFFERTFPGSSKLGGPGMQGVGNPAQPDVSAKDRPVSGEDAAAKAAEMKDLIGLFNQTEDPEMKAFLRGQIKALGPFDNYDSLSPSTRAAVDAQFPTNNDLANNRSPGEKRPNETLQQWSARGGLEQWMASGVSPDKGETQQQALDRWMRGNYGEGSILASSFFDQFGRYPDWKNKKDYEASLKDFLGGYLGNDDSVPNQAKKALAWDYKGGAEGLPHNELYDSYAMIRYLTDPSESNRRRIFDMMSTSKPSDLMNLGGPQTENMNTKDGKPEPGLSSPDATILNAVTGNQDFIDAVKSGDPKEIAKQAAMAIATIIPFPGSKVLGKAAVEGGGKLIDATMLEARRAEKGIAESGIHPAQAAIFDDLKSMKDDTLVNIHKSLSKSVNSKGISEQDRQFLLQKMDDIENELIKRNTIEPTAGMKKLEDIRSQAFEQKLSDITNKNSNLVDLGAVRDKNAADSIKNSLSQGVADSTLTRAPFEISPGLRRSVKLTPDDMAAGMNFSDKAAQLYARGLNLKLPRRAYSDTELKAVDKLRQMNDDIIYNQYSKEEIAYKKAQLEQAVKNTKKLFAKSTLKTID